MTRNSRCVPPSWLVTKNNIQGQPAETEEEIRVRVILDRRELARRLLGSGASLSPDRDAVAELISERAGE